MHYHIRQIRPSDLPSILAIQSACYPAELNEEQDAFSAKLTLSPNTNWLIEANEQIFGYLFCHPWFGDEVPTLNGKLASLPVEPDRFYLHDLAIHPQARGLNLSTTLTQHALRWAQANNYQLAMLVAIAGAERYWQKIGFEEYEQQGEALQKYGQARLMIKHF